MTYDFDERLKFSLDGKVDNDKQLLKDIFLGCIDVQKTSEEIDKQGIDYIVILKDGAEIFVDVKTREKGASKYWKYGEPELAIEIWSVYKTKVGWTFSKKSAVDYILYTFDFSDSRQYYLLPFQQLRIVSQKNYYSWKNQYKVAMQDSYAWQSQAIFVPASIVINAIQNEMQGLTLKGGESNDCVS